MPLKHSAHGIGARLAKSMRGVLAAAICGLSGCQPAPIGPQPDPAPYQGTGYIVFSAPIFPASKDLLLRDIDKLRSAGATEIHMGLNSPGGDIDAAQAIVDYMARAHDQNGVSFKVYNIGLVGSAATYIFLNAQNRYTAPRSAFLFHAAFETSNQPMTAEALREGAAKLDTYEHLMEATLKAHTRLTDTEAQLYVRRTVILNADDARRDGVVDGITAFTVPKGVRAWVITAKRPNGTNPNIVAPGTITPPTGAPAK